MTANTPISGNPAPTAGSEQRLTRLETILNNHISNAMVHDYASYFLHTTFNGDSLPVVKQYFTTRGGTLTRRIEYTYDGTTLINTIDILYREGREYSRTLIEYNYGSDYVTENKRVIV